VSLDAAYDLKERVKEATNIADLVGSYLDLRRQGQIFVARCPWHDDHKPSLQVNPSRQSWKCWVCNIGGDVFSFVMKREGVEFPEALRILADRAGVELNQQSQKSIKPGSAQDKKTLYQAMNWASDQFHQFLLKSAEAEIARQYLRDRQISELAIQQFKIGFAPDQWDWLKRQSPFSEEVLEACGLLVKTDNSKSYERFRGRVIFTINDVQSRPIAFGGRILPEIAEKEESERGRSPAKYINSPETRLFSKSDTLFALDMARNAIAKNRSMIIVEGYTDVIGIWQAGLENVVAVLGTALNERHIRLIRRYADQVTLVLDGDAAGQKRASEILELFVSADLDLRILTLPGGMDPFEFLLQNDAHQFRELMDRAPDALDHKLDLELSGFDPVRDTHQANRALENMLRTLAQIPAHSSTLVRRDQLVSRLARTFAIESTTISNRLKDLRTTVRARSVESDSGTDSPSFGQLISRERDLLEILLADERFLDQFVENISPNQFVQGPARIIYEVFCECFLSGRPAGFQNVMNYIEDPAIQNLLVQIDEQAQDKYGNDQSDYCKQIADILRAFDEADILISNQQTIGQLDQKNLNDQEETMLLEQLLEQTRRRQGITTPTDG
jgi:DNA primase